MFSVTARSGGPEPRFPGCSEAMGCMRPSSILAPGISTVVGSTSGAPSYLKIARVRLGLTELDMRKTWKMKRAQHTVRVVGRASSSRPVASCQYDS
jgi:hypothetical protein